MRMLKTPGVMEFTMMYRYYESIGLEHATLFASELWRFTIDGLDWPCGDTSATCGVIRFDYSIAQL